MSFSNFVRDSFWGRIIYHLSNHKLFSFKEEHPDYVLPEKYFSDAKNLDCERTDGLCVSLSDTSVAEKRVIVDWDDADDPENPRNWSGLKKGVFTAEICFLTLSVYIASGIYTPGVEEIMEDLSISRTKAMLPLTMFVIGYGIGPMVFSPMSENAIFGRTYIYIITLFLFFILSIPTALVHDIASLSVLRFIGSIFASPALATGTASLGDIVSPAYLPLFIIIWSISCICGPSFGPLFGAVLVVKRNWHWPFWLVAMAAGSAFVILGWFLPETYEKTLLLRKAKRLRRLTGNSNITSPGEIENEGLTSRQLVIDILWRPIEIALFEPMVLAIDIYIAFVYSIQNIWFEAFPVAYLDVYKFALIPFGVTFVSAVTGLLIAACFYSFFIFRRVTLPGLRGEGLPPEVFIPPMIVGALLMPTGVFIFGWTVSPDIHWFPSLIGSALFAMGGFMTFQTGLSYLGASFYHYLASVFAGNDLVRSVMAGSFPLFATPLFNNLSIEKYPVGWGSSVLGFILIAMISIPVTFYLIGPKLRARSKYSSLDDGTN